MLCEIVAHIPNKTKTTTESMSFYFNMFNSTNKKFIEMQQYKDLCHVFLIFSENNPACFGFEQGH